MTLEIPQIVELIENPANKELIRKAREYSDKCNLHVNGQGLDTFFSQIKEYENDTQLKLRTKYARSNKYLFDQMLRPLDKIFTARGGAKYYNIGGSDYKDETEFRSILSDVKNGLSLEKWIQKVWMKKRIIDPNGIMLLETSENGRSCYPTYKSSYSILDYKYSGIKVEYVIFEPIETETEKRYRVIDDVWDYIFIENKSPINDNKETKIVLVPEESFRHGYKQLPAIMISDVEDDLTGIKVSFIDNVIELGNEILVDNSVKIIFKFTQGFPAYWEIERMCLPCKGTGKLDAEDCPHCHGTGVRQKKDISDKIIVTMDEMGKAGAIPPAGYVSSDVATWQQMNSEADMMEKLMEKAMWGTLAMISEKIYQTATGVVGDLQPVYDRLYPVSSEAENIEKFFTDLTGEFYYNTSYKGCTIVYGKRFGIESPDQLLKKISEAKIGDVPSQSVSNMYMEYIQTMYSNDPFEMARQIKLFKLDNYPLYTAKELKAIGFTPQDIYSKVAFDQWVNTLTVDKIFFTPNEILLQERDSFIQTKVKDYEVLQRNSVESVIPQRQAS